MSSFGQEEAASWTDIVKEEQLLLLIYKNKNQDNTINTTHRNISEKDVHYSDVTEPFRCVDGLVSWPPPARVPTALAPSHRETKLPSSSAHPLCPDWMIESREKPAARDC